MQDIYFHIEYCKHDGERILTVSHPAVLVNGEICFSKYKISVEDTEEINSEDKSNFIPGRVNYKVKVYERVWKDDKRFSRV